MSTDTATATATATAPVTGALRRAMNTSSTVQHVVNDDMGAWPNPATENQTNPTPTTVKDACDIIQETLNHAHVASHAHAQKIQALETQVSTLVDKLAATQTRLGTAMDRLAAQDARGRELERREKQRAERRKRQELLERQERQDNRSRKRPRTAAPPSKGVVATLVDMVDSALQGSPK